jgi:UDP-N-acetylglucosamine--N-acetylmuramyl-(pentapeptide) pyrophosphoryl-undecaprenol N-acetylglucosamine transferase
VVGGSQGSEFLNQHVPELVGALTKLGVNVQVRHQVGKLAPAPVEQAYRDAAISASVEGFIDDMAAAYAWADFAVTRAGSGTVAELAAAALPALLVPFPFAAGDHQAANAAAFCAQGGGRWVRQGAWKLEELQVWAQQLLTIPEVWQRASQAAAAVALPQAAAAVVRDCGVWLGIPAWQSAGVQPSPGGGA